MSTLTDAQVAAIAEAVVLMLDHPEATSEFERELIVDIGRRFRDFGRNAVVTPAEWLAFSEARQGLRGAERRAAQLDIAFERAGFARARVA
jgi:lysylphosphatidylglycerol synthetase-like protein (DUF2156 family)